MTDRADGHVVEQLEHAGLFEKGAKQDKQEDVAGRDIGGGAVDAFGTECQLRYHLIQAVASVHQDVGQMLAEQGIGDEAQANHGQRPSHQAARRVEDHQQGDAADNPVGLAHVTGAVNEVSFEPPVIEGEQQGGRTQQQAPDRRPGQALATSTVDLVNQKQQKADMHGPDHGCGQGAEGGGDNLKD